MGSKSVACLTLVLRISNLLFAFASILLLLKYKIEFKQNNVTFKFGTYRYVFFTAVIAAVYALVQVPLAIYKLKKDKRTMDFLRKFDFYADGLVSLLLGTGVEAGFVVTKELRHLTNRILFVQNKGDAEAAFRKFLNRVDGGTGLLLGSFICMIVLFVLSFANRSARHPPDENPTASLQL